MLHQSFRHPSTCQKADLSITLRAKVSTTLFAISRDALKIVLDDHPHMRKYMTLIAQRRRLRLAFLNPENEVSCHANVNI